MEIAVIRRYSAPTASEDDEKATTEGYEKTIADLTTTAYSRRTMAAQHVV